MKIKNYGWDRRGWELYADASSIDGKESCTWSITAGMLGSLCGIMVGVVDVSIGKSSFFSNRSPQQTEIVFLVFSSHNIKYRTCKWQRISRCIICKEVIHTLRLQTAPVLVTNELPVPNVFDEHLIPKRHCNERTIGDYIAYDGDLYVHASTNRRRIVY